MEHIQLNCELITPLFMSGADGNTPEFRAPSIKGALRYWWRAMNGHLSFEDMKKEEGNIFGDTSQRSKIIIQSIEEVRITHNITKEAKVPHKPFKNDAISKGFQFKIKLALVESKIFTKAQLESLVFLTFTLGGLGNRSRRGFGSVKIEGYEQGSIDTIFNHLQNINPHFTKITEGGVDKIESQFKRANPYPFIKMIELGQPKSNLIQKIADTTHVLKQRDAHTYEASLGLASRERFASPIYVSIVSTTHGNAPIISTLNTVPPSSYSRDISVSLQNEFKRNIL
jgi:CRISPR-associated protein Cmr1